MRFLRRFQRRYASCFQSKTAALEKKKKSYNKLLCGHSERHSVDTGNGYSSIQLGHEHSTDDAPLSEHHRVGIPREPIGLFVYTSSKNTQVVRTRERNLGRRLTTTTLTHLSLKTRECRERGRYGVGELGMHRANDRHGTRLIWFLKEPFVVCRLLFFFVFPPPWLVLGAVNEGERLRSSSSS